MDVGTGVENLLESAGNCLFFFFVFFFFFSSDGMPLMFDGPKLGGVKLATPFNYLLKHVML